MLSEFAARFRFRLPTCCQRCQNCCCSPLYWHTPCSAAACITSIRHRRRTIGQAAVRQSTSAALTAHGNTHRPSRIVRQHTVPMKIASTSIPAVIALLSLRHPGQTLLLLQPPHQQQLQPASASPAKLPLRSLTAPGSHCAPCTARGWYDTVPFLTAPPLPHVIAVCPPGIRMPAKPRRATNHKTPLWLYSRNRPEKTLPL